MPIRVPAPGDDERRHGAACSERWPSYDGQVDSDSQVVIERNPEHGNAPQVGRVVRKVSGKRFVVDWGDGLENEVTAGSDFTTSRVPTVTSSFSLFRRIRSRCLRISSNAAWM